MTRPTWTTYRKTPETVFLILCPGSIIYRNFLKLETIFSDTIYDGVLC